MADFGFFYPLPKADREHLYLREWSPEVVPALRASGATCVRIMHWDDPSHGIDFLTECADQITHLEIGTPQIPDVSPVSRLHNLEEFSVSFSPVYGIEQRDLGHILDQVDFSQLQRLRACLISNVKSLGNLSACSGLEELSLNRVPLKDLTLLASFTTLRVLEVSELRLESLAGIECLTSLRTLILDSSVTSFPGSMREVVLTQEPVLREVSHTGRGPHRSPSGRAEAELPAESHWAQKPELLPVFIAS